MEFSYIIDALSNVSGGQKTGSDILGSLLLDFVLDGEESLGWKGATFEASVLAIHGGPFSDFVGDFQTVSNIEAPETVRLFRAYLQQRFLDERLSLILGLYNVDSEFDTRETADLFVHSSPGTGGDIGQLGTNGPGIFPVGALGSRIRYEENGWYGQFALTEGEPGDPDDPFGTTLRLDETEGAFLIGEVGKTWSDDHGTLGKVALGAWGFTAGFPTHLDPAASVSNRGAYLSLEKTLHRETDKDSPVT
jgi:porin